VIEVPICKNILVAEDEDLASWFQAVSGEACSTKRLQRLLERAQTELLTFVDKGGRRLDMTAHARIAEQAVQKLDHSYAFCFIDSLLKGGNGYDAMFFALKERPQTRVRIISDSAKMLVDHLGSKGGLDVNGLREQGRLYASSKSFQANWRDIKTVWGCESLQPFNLQKKSSITLQS